MTMSARFRRDVDALEEVFALVEAFFSRENLAPALRYPVDLALEEVFTNFVKYNAGAPSEIGVSLRRDPGEIVVSITDIEGKPFDPTRVPPPDLTAPLDERRPGGLGLHLTRKFMDRVEYDRRDSGSTVTLYKKVE
jgi:anti-sigma regulatory factor (Ser/Thr protein kinase)